MESDSQSQTFLDQLFIADSYPESVLAHKDNKGIVEASRERFNEHRESLFDREVRKWKHLIHLVIRDYGYTLPEGYKEDKNCDSLSTIKCGVQYRQLLLTDFESLATRLAWPHISESKQHVEKPLLRDPKCRFILFQTVNSDSRLLQVTERMMMLVLTYHQVHPCYLNFIMCHNSSTSACDLQFGGFHSSLVLANAGPSIPALGRSGKHYQLSFRLQTIQRHNTGDSPRWRKQTAAVYHTFDVKAGTSLWILTCQQEQRSNKTSVNYLWEKVRGSIARPNCRRRLGANEAHDRFAASLEVIDTLAEWSLGTCSLYLHHLEETLLPVTDKYLYPLNPNEDEKPETIQSDLRQMASVRDALQDCDIRLKNNKRVLKSLISFYHEELWSEVNQEKLTLEWETLAEPHIQDLLVKLRNTIAQVDSILERSVALHVLAENKERLVQQLLQNGQNRKMESLTQLTKEDSTAMKNFALITLYLLPITVASTVMSTDIVKFQDISPPTSSYEFSTTAFVTWIIFAIVLTVVCLASSVVFQPRKWLRNFLEANAIETDGASLTLDSGKENPPPEFHNDRPFNGGAVPNNSAAPGDELSGGLNPNKAPQQQPRPQRPPPLTVNSGGVRPSVPIQSPAGDSGIGTPSTVAKKSPDLRWSFWRGSSDPSMLNTQGSEGEGDQDAEGSISWAAVRRWFRPGLWGRWWSKREIGARLPR